MPRQNSKERISSRRKRRNVIYIFCEGKETEIIYFKNFRTRGASVDIRLITSQKKVARHLIEESRKTLIREDYSPEDGDQVWCVFDRDSNTNEELAKAQQLATKHNFNIVFSNPSFELWFLLHFANQRALLKDGSAVVRKLNAIPEIGTYEKSKNYYSLLKPLQNIAAERARHLIRFHGQNNQPILHTDSNPCTTVVELVEELLKIRES